MVRSLFDKDNPVKSPQSQHEKPASNIRMLIALNLMANLAQPESTFSLLSDSEFHHRMRRYRGFQGMLDSSKISQPDLLALRQVIQLSDENLHESIASSKDSFTAIADSGCSFTCTNNKADFTPDP